MSPWKRGHQAPSGPSRCSLQAFCTHGITPPCINASRDTKKSLQKALQSSWASSRCSHQGTRLTGAPGLSRDTLQGSSVDFSLVFLESPSRSSACSFSWFSSFQTKRIVSSSSLSFLLLFFQLGSPSAVSCPLRQEADFCSR